MLGLWLVLLALSLAPLAGASDTPVRTGEELGRGSCGQWLPLENVAGTEDIRRQPAPMLLRRPVEPAAEVFRAPVRERMPQEHRFRLVTAQPRAHRVMTDWGRRPFRL